MPEYVDFQEIAHCGGQVTFTVQCDADGQRSCSLGYRGNGAGPVRLIGIYALAPQGIPISDSRPPFDSPCPEGCFPVVLASDSHGAWGHQCQRCSGYFRNGNHPAIYPLTCPYCGIRCAAYRFLTDAQRAYVQHYIAMLVDGLEEIQPGTQRELVIDMDAAVKQGADQTRPEFYYAAESQQTRYNCGKCGSFNDIRGLYGYCASCGWRNNVAILRRVFEEMRNRLNDGSASASATVRSAVSEFDACCRDFAAQLTQRVPMKPGRRHDLERVVFHDIDSATISLKSMFGIDVLHGLDKQKSFIIGMMHRRHIFEHNAGVADERYVNLSGDPDGQRGTLIRETKANAHRLIGHLTRMAENFEEDFHEIFPPTEWPVDFHRERQERMRQR